MTKITTIDKDDFFDPVKLKDCHKKDIIVIKEPEQIIEINGIKYRKRPDKIRHKGFSNILAATILMAGGIPQMKEPKPPKEVDIISEFALIQHKKSNLSKRQRDLVEWEFNQKYEKVTQDK